MEKKCILAVIISCISTATSLVCIGIVTCNNFKANGIITIDTFIGVIAALIGVCATIMVGLQIWNHIEFNEVKEKSKHIDRLSDSIDKDKKRVDLIRTELLLATSNTLFGMAHSTSDPSQRAINLILSITYEDTKELQGVDFEHFSECVLDRYVFLNATVKEIELGTEKLFSMIERFQEVQIHKDLKDYSKITELRAEIIYRLNQLKEEYNNYKITETKSE